MPDWISRDLPDWNSRDVPARNCDPDNKNTLAEIKSEIRNLQQLLDGLSQKLDPDFKLPPPRKLKGNRSHFMYSFIVTHNRIFISK